MVPRHDVVPGVLNHVLEQPRLPFHQGAPEVVGRKDVSGTGAVHHDQAGLRVDTGEQRRRVAIAEEHLGIRPDQVVIEMGEHPRRTPTAAGEDALHLGIGEELHDVRGPLGIASREIAPPPVVVGAEPGFQPDRPEGIGEDFRRVGLEGGGGRAHEPEDVTGTDTRRPDRFRSRNPHSVGRYERHSDCASEE